MRIAIIIAAALCAAAATALVACSPASRTCGKSEEAAVLAVLANGQLTGEQKAEQLAVLGVDLVSCVLANRAAAAKGSSSGSGQ